MARIINATPHEVSLVVGDTVIRIPPAETPVRATEVRERVGTVTLDGHQIPIYIIRYGEPVGLPELGEEDFIIVSSIAAQAILQHRPELTGHVLVTADAVRDEQGRIIGARALALP